MVLSIKVIDGFEVEEIFGSTLDVTYSASLLVIALKYLARHSVTRMVARSKVDDYGADIKQKFRTTEGREFRLWRGQMRFRSSSAKC